MWEVGIFNIVPVFFEDAGEVEDGPEAVIVVGKVVDVVGVG